MLDGKWDLSKLYKSNDEFLKDYELSKKLVNELEKFRGEISKSDPQIILDYFEKDTKLSIILEKLAVAMDSHYPQGGVAQEVAKMHQQWLGYTWPNYTKEAHAGLAMMYVSDERFTAYYDEAIKPGAAQFLCDAILHYTKQ